MKFFFANPLRKPILLQVFHNVIYVNFIFDLFYFCVQLRKKDRKLDKHFLKYKTITFFSIHLIYDSNDWQFHQGSPSIKQRGKTILVTRTWHRNNLPAFILPYKNKFRMRILSTFYHIHSPHKMYPTRISFKLRIFTNWKFLLGVLNKFLNRYY